MIATNSHRAHSADVTIGLLISDEWLPVGQLGPDFLLLDVVADHPPCDAIVKLRVDDVERRWSVRLPHGISPTSDRVALALSN
jgi:hypothetical protein